MGDIAAYILLFSIGIGTLYIYQRRRKSTKHVRLSIQNYSDCILKILLKKKEGKPQFVIVRIMAKNDLALYNSQLEMIDSERNFHIRHLNEISDHYQIPQAISKSKYFDLNIPYEEFIEILKVDGFKLSSFRFSVENQKGKKYKSHELTLNKKGNIYKPDSGRYN